MNLKLLFSVISFFSYLANLLCFIWGIVEFCLYLFKNHEFNWWSLYSWIISALLAVIFLFATALTKDK